MKLTDFSYVQRNKVPHGKVIIVGMMEDGPTGNIFTLIDEDSATHLLGDNETSRAYNLLINSGIEKENIYLFRLNGVPATALVEVDEKPVLQMQTLSSHVEEQKVSYTISEEGIVLFSEYSEEIISEGKRRNFKKVYRFDEFSDLRVLAEAITQDASRGVHGVIAENIIYGPSNILAKNPGRMTFLYGDDESSLVVTDGEYPESKLEEKDGYLGEYWNKFYEYILGEGFEGEVSSTILDVAAEVIYFPDIPVDEAIEIAELAGQAAEKKTDEQQVLCTALFRTGLVPTKRELSEDEYINADGTFFNESSQQIEEWKPLKEKEDFLQKLDNSFTEEQRSEPWAKYIQVVVGDEYATSEEIIPGATHHLVHLINQSLKPTTNKELIDFNRVNSPLDQKEIANLTSKGYICIVESIRRNAVTSKVKSIYNSQSIIDEFQFRKVLSYISYDIRIMLDQYIGTNISMYSEVKLNEILEEYLTQYVADGIMQSFKIGDKNINNIENTSSVKIDIVMYGQIESIKGAIALSNTGWEVDLWAI